MVNPALLEAPSRPVIVALLDTYVYRVDSILKVTHVPLLRTLLLPDGPVTSEPLNVPSYEALKFAVCFTAACTLSEAECRAIFVDEKDRIINKLRLATEVVLSQAKILTTSDVTVLQAFVIYLVSGPAILFCHFSSSVVICLKQAKLTLDKQAGRRTCDGYKKIWTLIACAVRIGQSLGLDTDESRSRTPFQMEMRRRLWYSIGMLDLQAAFDGASHSVIASNGLLGRPPLNIDDSTFSPASGQSAFVEKSGLTNMSFSSMTHEALICWRKLTHVPTDSEGQPLKIRQEWSKRSQIVQDWEKNMNEKYLQHCDMTQPFQKFMKIVGQDMVISKKLLVRRPMHRLFSAGPPPADGFNVLEVATDVVERSLRKFTDPTFAAWSWYGWVKWYVLAIILVELCGQGNGPLIDRAWKAAEEAFPKFAELVIDDVLWRSVEKLMRKARANRDSSLRSSALAIPASFCSRGVSSNGNLSSDGLNEAENRFQDNRSTWHADDMRPHNGLSQSNPNLESPSVNGQNPPLLSIDMDSTVPETWVDEPEYMSWVNWGLFVQDFGDYNEQNMLDMPFGG